MPGLLPCKLMHVSSKTQLRSEPMHHCESHRQQRLWPKRTRK